jgi:FKBP-type peptidyl-prolyl cis-trans isomerase FklB
VTLKNFTMRYLTTFAVAPMVALLVWTTVGQEASTESKGQQTPAATKPQPEAAAPSKSESETSTAKTEAAVTPAPSQPVGPVIQSRKDKISYAFGMDLARDLKRQKNDLNVDLLMRALKDALADKPLLMTDDEVTATLKQLEVEQKQDYEHARTMIGEKNRRAGESFFSENAKKEGVVTLPSGLQYKILKKGDGKIPTLDDKIVCHYRGTLVDGTEFDSSYRRSQPATLPVKGVIAGWTQALQLMPIGSKWQIFIPPQLAYGEKIVHGIGPNAMLIFEVELLSIQDKAQTASTTR